ncbi:MAG: glycosyl transferase family 2 [Chloroflexi bacterium]|nr:MAG: glycosyl transferase family 2 [Chloroflexota bacterium]
MSSPYVSVVMPVYNAESYVAEAVESILSQTFRDFEFLIFDDGSTDRSLLILQHYGLRDARIRLYGKPHRGYVPWLNEGVQIARGKLIARMDADDVALPQRFACQVEYLQENLDAVAVGSDCLAIDPDGAPLHRLGYDGDHKTDEASLLNGSSEGMIHPTVMIRRDALVSIGGYREQFEFVEDYDLWFRLAEKGRLGLIPNVLLKHRLHCKTVSFSQVARQRALVDLIIAEHRTRKGLPPLAHSVWRYNPPTTTVEAHQWWANLAAANGYYRTALKHSFKSFQIAPWSGRSWWALSTNLIPRSLRQFLKRALSSSGLLKAAR